MITVNFDQMYESLKSGIESVSKNTLHDYLTEAKEDGRQALESIKENLQHWAEEVENGAMTYEDLEFLLKGEEGLNEMMALKQAGLAAVHIDKFKEGLINMIIGTVISVIKV